MKSKQQLGPPENWQDFESLCKKLWGEIWNCPEIKKNGRQGQSQCGVDIYGTPSGNTGYYGIQCKGKDNYTQKKFTKKEIDTEINKAKSFKPNLKQFYLATTAVKDALIEEYIREKNQEHIESGLFSIHIFSWEDIVDLIYENKETHDWYVKSLNFKHNQDAIMTFHNNEKQIEIVVPFVQKVLNYKQSVVPANSISNEFVISNLPSFTEIANIKPFSFFDSKVNHSYCKFALRLHNSGTDPIENFKIFLSFDGKFESIDTVNKSNGVFSQGIKYSYDTFIDNDKKIGEILPEADILVGDDFIEFDDIEIKPIHEPSKIVIKWKLLSKDCRREGELTLNISPKIEKENKTILVKDPLEVKVVEGNIEDYITNGEEE